MTIVNETGIKKYLRSFATFESSAHRQLLGDYLTVALLGPLKTRQENLREITIAHPGWSESYTAQFNARSNPWMTFAPDEGLNTKIGIIADWIKSAMVNKEPWLQDTDAGNIPHTFHNIRSLDDATALAKDAALLAAQEKWHGHDEEAEGHIRTEMNLTDGYRIVRLLTPTALDREGDFLGLCIGKGKYDGSLRASWQAFYSLRDANNKPHATFDVSLDTNTLNMLRGAQNHSPAPKYFPAIQEFLSARQFKLPHKTSQTGLLLQDGVYYDIYNLPENFTCTKILSYRNTKQNITLPAGLTVAEVLFIEDCPGFTAFPKNLSVESIYIRNCPNLKTIPGDCSVESIVVIEKCQGLTALPDDLLTATSVNLNDCFNLSALPQNLRTGNLHVYNCPGVQEIPASLKASYIRTDLGEFLTRHGARTAFYKKFGVGQKPVWYDMFRPLIGR